ncbi:MAG: hypothetical protein GY847_42230 [Proteobacteria bacterium]|nr:hypothetical protein [Pseudomonadota bacterium]
MLLFKRACFCTCLGIVVLAAACSRTQSHPEVAAAPVDSTTTQTPSEPAEDQSSDEVASKDDTDESPEETVTPNSADEEEVNPAYEEFMRNTTGFEEDRRDANVAKQNADALMASELTKQGNARNNKWVKQPDANIYWLRCPIGQEWNGKTCVGKQLSFDWKSAKKACPAGYKLPTAYDYLMLADGESDYKKYYVVRGYRDVEAGGCERRRDTCARLFGSNLSWYWTATASPCRKTSANIPCKRKSLAYIMAFSQHQLLVYDKSKMMHVRCVRK